MNHVPELISVIGSRIGSIDLPRESVLFQAVAESARILNGVNLLHQRTRNYSRDIYADWWCPQCRVNWPCPTGRLLNPKDSGD